MTAFDTNYLLRHILQDDARQCASVQSILEAQAEVLIGRTKSSEGYIGTSFEVAECLNYTDNLNLTNVTPRNETTPFRMLTHRQHSTCGKIVCDPRR
jgi:hypothetical protein